MLKINILSIDFDYFVDATASQRALMFPDANNEDLDMPLQIFVWMSLYSDSIIANRLYGKDDIRDIRALKQEIKALFKLINKFKKPATKLFVHESHKDIAEIIFKENKNSDNIKVFNIDFHHDCWLTEDSSLHCGNWGRILMQDKMIEKLYWIKRSDSDCEKIELIEHVYDSIGSLYKTPKEIADGIDYIFLCRSAAWSPLHLDDDFVKLALDIADILYIDEPEQLDNMIYRWGSEIQDTIKMMVKQQSALIEKIEKK